MDNCSSNKESSGIRLKLESLRHIAKNESSSFRKRNHRINKILESLGIQIVASTGSLGLLLFLGFSNHISPMLIFAAFGALSILILKLKFKAIRLSKGLKHKEPEINEGSLIARIKGDSYEFYLIEKKSSFHYYLSPVKYEHIFNRELGHFSTLPQATENKKTLLFHKKRVFENFYIVVNSPWSGNRNHQISA